jgi:hypothetical protein
VGPVGDAGGSCASFAAAQCQYLSACLPGDLQSQYGSVTACQSAVETTCTNGLGAAGSGITTSWLSGCTAERTTSAAACTGTPSPRPVPTSDACVVTGAGGAGAPCGLDAQCATNHCDRVGSVCGVCTAAGKLGDACGPGTAVTCGVGLGCGKSNTCATIVDVGKSCDHDVTTRCVDGAYCAGPPTGGMCAASGATAGAPCGTDPATMANCWDQAGFFCDGVTSQCAAITYQPSGSACGLAEGGASDDVCQGGACVSGTCVGPVAAGGACAVGAGSCAAGTICAEGRGSSGPTCQAVSAACASQDGGLAPFTFSPTNVSLTSILGEASKAVDEVVSSMCGVQTDPSSPDTDCFTSPIVAVTQEDGSTVDLIVVRSLKVQSPAAIIVTGSVPLVLVSLSDMTLMGGNIQANSNTATLGVGPGGAPGLSIVGAGGGPGGGVTSSASALVGASGGSYCGLGGLGGGGTMTGKTYGNGAIRPLVGGSAGGGGSVGSGAGGGALQLVAAGTLTIASGVSVTVGGEGGPIGGAPSAFENSGGGGSGGSILVEASSVTIAGTLAANGGGGGGDYSGNGGADGTANAMAAPGGVAGPSDGAGGAGGAASTIAGGAGTAPAGLGGGGGGGGVGRIRINSAGAAATLTGATLSPALATSCAGQGSLRGIAAGP